MSSTTQQKSSRVKVGEHRARLRAQGLRPLQIWVPDVRAPSFKTAAHQQSAAVAASPQNLENQAYIDTISELADE